MRDTIMIRDLIIKLRPVVYPLLIVLSVILPLFLYDNVISFEFFGSTHTYSLFKLFAFFASISVITISSIELIKKNDKDFNTAVPILLIAGVSLHFLILITEYPTKSWDYICYENAAKNFIQNLNPYEGTYYLYPPLIMQGLSLAWRFVLDVFSFNSDFAWDIVFYFYQSVQFLLLVLFCILLYLFGRKLKMAPLVSAVAAGILLTFNNPLIRTLEYNQVSLLLLNLVLLSMLLTDRYPFTAGLISSVAVHIKIFPILMFFPWLFRKQFNAVAGLITGIILIPVFSLLNQDFLVYKQFFTASVNSYEIVPFMQYGYFRDNSINSIIHSVLVMVGGIVNYKFPLIVQKSLTILASLGVFILYLIRMKIREKQENAGEGQILYGHVMDTLAAILLLSPLSWEHFYLLSTPLFLWGYYYNNLAKRWLQMVALTLVLWMPTIDIFPFGYNRIIGLVILLYLIRPTLYTKPVK